MRLPLVVFGKVVAGEVAANGAIAAVSPAGGLNNSSCGPTGELYSSHGSMAVEIANITPSSLCSGSRNSSITHAISSMVPPIDSNAFIRRSNIHTSAEDQNPGLEDRGTAERTPHGTKMNHRSQRTHRWAPYPSVRDAEGSDIWPASVGRHGGLRETVPLVESTVISVASALRHAGPFPCSRMSTWSLRLAAAVATLRGVITMTVAARMWHGRTSKSAACLSAAAIVLELFLRKLGSEAMHTGTMKWGAVAELRRATHGTALMDHSLVGCSKRATASSGGGHRGGLLSCTIGSSAQYTGLNFTGGHLFALQFALTAAYPPHHMLSSILPNSPPGSTVWIRDSASSVHGTGSGKFVYNKGRPLPAEASLLISDGR